MNPRVVRGALAALGLGVLLAVGLTLRRPAPAPSPQPAPKARRAETRTTGLVYRRFKEGRERFVLEAGGMAGREGEAMRLTGVKLTFAYTAQGEPGQGTIASDECVYHEAGQRAAFKGHVRLTTADGFELATDSLNYRGDRGVARTDDPAQFRRKDVSGSSEGMEYHEETGRLVLAAAVRMRIVDEPNPPADVEAERAVAQRERGTLRLEGDVRLVQGRDTLRAGILTLMFRGEARVLYRALASGKVDLRSSGDSAMAGAAGPPGGARQLRSERLDIRFREDRTMKGALASGNAELTVMPGPGQRPERRRLRAKVLRFAFDEDGRLSQLGGAKQASLLVESPEKSGGEPRSAEGNRFLARLDPATGDPRFIDFKRGVVFTRGGQKATAETARYTGADRTLRLEKAPKLIQDDGQLTARKIQIATDKGDVAADGDVRHLLGRAARGGLMSGSDTPTLVTCGRFRYEARTRTAEYAEQALLRSGQEEVRAPTIVVVEDAQGRRRLTAREPVASLLHPRQEGDGKPAAPVSGRAKEMVYEEAGGRITYTGDVVLQQGDILTRSPKATLTLTKDGRGIEKMVAGEPVEVQQGERHASGRSGTYTPKDETMVLVGDKAVLQDKDKRTEGSSLTFHVGDDTILVEGREEGRTETILKQEPPRR